MVMAPARAVHPRARGEQWRAFVLTGLLGGSSPRARGTGRARRRPENQAVHLARAGEQNGVKQGTTWRRFIPARGEQQ